MARTGIPRRQANIVPNMIGEWGGAMARVVAALGTGAMICLVGPRGTGKTRLGVAAIRRTCYRMAQRRVRVEDEFGHRPSAVGEYARWAANKKAAMDGADNERAALYTTAMGLFIDIRSTFGGGGGEKRVVDDLCGFRLLVIDEIQERGNTEWETRLLTHIIDRRYAAMLDTIIIGNLTPQSLAATLGASFTDRLNECGVIIECNWPSFRTTTGGG